jgi:predicted nucleic acid-binding protein
VEVRIALDTNRYTDLCRGDLAVIEKLARAESVWMPFIVLAELRAGFSVGKRGRENERVLRRFLAKPRVEALYADDATTRVHATLYRQLRQQGTPMSSNDLWIAALAIEHGLVLYSRDQQFAHLAQLEILD